MTLFELFLRELDQRNSYLLCALVALCFMARKLLPEAEKRRVLPLIGITLGHLAMVLVTASVEAGDSTLVRYPRLVSFILSMLAYAGVFNFIAFSMLLSRFNLGMHLVLRDVFTLLVVALAVFYKSAQLGFNLTGLGITGGALVTVIGFGLKDTIGNMTGRVALQLDRSVSLGDWLKLDDGTMGQVTQMRWRYTMLQTNNWETIVIPNNQLLNSRITVLGRRDGQPTQLRRWIWFHVDYKVAPAEVIKLVDDALNEEALDHVAAFPRPNAVLMSIEGSIARYAARYWLTNLVHDDVTDSMVRTRLSYAMRRAGVEFAIPGKNIFLTEQDEARATAQAEQDLRARSQALATVGIFKGLKEEERLLLARSMRRAPFAEGEYLTRQGAAAHWLYIVEKGSVSVRVSVEGGVKEVAKLGPGSFFGEMALMTGEPRTATVVALENVDCFRLDKDAFNVLMAERPELATEMAEELARRKTELDAAKENLDKEARERRHKEAKKHLVDRIKTFFAVK